MGRPFTHNALENYLDDGSVKLIETENSCKKPQTTGRQVFHMATMHTKDSDS